MLSINDRISEPQNFNISNQWPTSRREARQQRILERRTDRQQRLASRSRPPQDLQQAFSETLRGRAEQWETRTRERQQDLLETYSDMLRESAEHSIQLENSTENMLRDFEDRQREQLEEQREEFENLKRRMFNRKCKI